MFVLLVFIRWNEEGRWVQYFLLLPLGSETFPSNLPRARWRNLVCVVFVDDYANGGWFLFYWGLMLLWAMDEFLFFSVALIVGGWRFVSWGRKFYLGPAEIWSFSRQDLSRPNKHASFWLVVSTRYFYILFLWAIVASDFLPLKIHKHLVLPLTSITFTANNQADNHVYKYIYLFQTLYSMKSVFY